MLPVNYLAPLVCGPLPVGRGLNPVSCVQVEDSSPRVSDGVLQSLQEQLNQKQRTLVELMEREEERKLQEIQQRRTWLEERTHLSRRVDQLQDQLEDERERGRGVESERDRLQRALAKMMEESRHAVSQTNLALLA